VLATVLWNYTLPLIRYEISDHLKLAAEACACGRTFQLIEEIEGREEQVIFLESESGEEVRVEPDLFFDNMVLLPIDGWQVAQEREDAITFLILRPRAEFKEAAFLQRIGDEIEKLGAKRPTLKVEAVNELRRTKLGKLITIQACREKSIDEMHAFRRIARTQPSARSSQLQHHRGEPCARRSATLDPVADTGCML